MEDSKGCENYIKMETSKKHCEKVNTMELVLDMRIFPVTLLTSGHPVPERDKLLASGHLSPWDFSLRVTAQCIVL